MRLIPVKSLKVGRTLGFPIRSQDGRILLSANSPVTDKYIERLIQYKINGVYIEEENFEDVDVRPAISDNTKSAALVAVAEFYKAFQKKGPIKETLVRNTAKTIADEVLSNARSPINLFNVYSIDDKRYLHAVNTAVVTSAIAYHAGVPVLRIHEYATAALMHDIAVEDINTKDIRHAGDAVERFKAERLFSNIIQASVAMHHEHYDGSGGPKKFEGEKIFEGARIVAIADCFDNLAYGIGCEAMPLHMAVEYMSMLAGKQLDPRLFALFSKAVALYPTGATVLLNNGYRAIVVKQNDDVPARPIVRLLMPERANCLEFNLITNRTLFVENVEL